MLHDGKVALVTGGASGIGRSTAIVFAREGARVAVADIAMDGAEETVATIIANGGEAVAVHADMLQPESIRAMIDQTVAHFGGLDVAFNNAGHSGGRTNILDCDDAEWDMVMNLNLKAVWLCMKYEIPEMLKRGGGAIVNTASGMANFAGPGMATYTVSKTAVLGLTRSAAVDFGPKGIRVNALLPGATDTQMLRAAVSGAGAQTSGMAERIPLRRVSQPEEQAEAAVWLASERASFVTGFPMIVDGGVTAVR
jgi:NAD(P)-dependent dehydrogenase (short-subunit alcohol dehydrogenase family)